MDKSMKVDLVITADGSHTLFVPGLNEHYHSIHGAVQESEIVFIRNGFRFSVADPVNIFEAGFGTGLNALLTLHENLNETRRVNYTSIEKYPLNKELHRSLNHFSFAGEKGSELHRAIHESRWGIQQPLTDRFSLLKIEADLLDFRYDHQYNLVYFDAFGPDKQPEVWSERVLRRIADATLPGGIFVTYSVQGNLRKRLKECRFEIELLPGPSHKRQVLRAVKY